MREAAALSAVVRNWQGQIFRVKGVVATLHTAAGVFLHVFSLFISSPSRANKEKTCTNERFETLLDGGINALILAPSYPSDSLGECPWSPPTRDTYRCLRNNDNSPATSFSRLRLSQPPATQPQTAF